jgi:hypothetical protein
MYASRYPANARPVVFSHRLSAFRTVQTVGFSNLGKFQFHALG